MRHLHSLTHSVTTLSAIALLALAAGCSKSTNTGTAGSVSLKTSQATSALQAKTASKLGDLSAFRTITAEVAAVVVNKDVASSHAAFLNSSGGFRSGFSQTSS
ncbi:sulfur carrier protein ThiS, partial [Janthinobacterium sp. CAN_S1]